MTWQGKTRGHAGQGWARLEAEEGEASSEWWVGGGGWVRGTEGGDKCVDGQSPKIKESARSRADETTIEETYGMYDIGVVCRITATGKQIRIAVAGASSHWPF